MRVKYHILILILFICVNNINSQQIWKYYTNIRPIEILIDSANTKWFATYNGLARLKGNTWTVWDTSNSPLLEDFLSSVTKDMNNNIWVATKGSGVYKFDGQNWTRYFSIPQIGYSLYSVHKIRVDSLNNLWICCGGLSLVKFEQMTNNWKRFWSGNSPIVGYGINDICIDGNIKWIASVSGGLYKFDDINWSVYNTSNSPLLSNFIESISIDYLGNKWIGTRFGGIGKFNSQTNQWSIFTPYNSGLPGGNILTIFPDSIKKWISLMSYPFVSYNDLIWENYLDSSYLGRAHDFKKDRFGNLWIGDGNGVMVYNINGVVNIKNNAEGILESFSTNVYPNPFNSQTKISYNINQSSNVRINIFDISGKLIKELRNNYHQTGEYVIIFDSNGLSSGIYFCILETEKHKEIRKLVLIK